MPRNDVKMSKQRNLTKNTQAITVPIARITQLFLLLLHCRQRLHQLLLLHQLKLTSNKIFEIIALIR